MGTLDVHCSVMFYLHSQLLMKNMQLLMTSVDCLQQDTYRLLGYEKTVAKQIQAKQQFLIRRVCNLVHVISLYPRSNQCSITILGLFQELNGKLYV